ncbi:MAG: hypothetical protein D6790_00375 [Caldilineae bacterium]|nr:MAG: hypothetical protein D6790_00375 [Caldilineae bacterium]
MYIPFLTLLLLAAVISTVWVYWRVQGIEQHLVQQEASMRDKAREMAELADEILMASEYLYREMDRCLERIEEPVLQVRRPVESHGEAEASVENPQSPPTLPAQDAPGPTSSLPAEESSLAEQDKDEHTATPAHATKVQEDSAAPLPNLMEVAPTAHVSDDEPEAAEPPLDAHFQALELASQGVDALEIARQTGLGTEELRLLLHFREAINMAS